ncbi:unnamed protein product [Haemonchus placei]|uniref:Uncharacterized protein n=1 Tax=Haemonchus placei TaxID=6290 RepID=A0A3P7VJL8_HAEPC|nr:unnamed protein product [Haemonchus placei]
MRGGTKCSEDPIRYCEPSETVGAVYEGWHASCQGDRTSSSEHSPASYSCTHPDRGPGELSWPRVVGDPALLISLHLRANSEERRDVLRLRGLDRLRP